MRHQHYLIYISVTNFSKICQEKIILVEFCGASTDIRRSRTNGSQRGDPISLSNRSEHLRISFKRHSQGQSVLSPHSP